ncbi:M48 family metalloprotease [Streptomyces sp. NPDC006516]|uniref:M48 family metalloprotease n=1 Tax=Streptomyces sp. NPDC006516 TaxID=3154309 RepID=UPI0033B35DF4
MSQHAPDRSAHKDRCVPAPTCRGESLTDDDLDYQHTPGRRLHLAARQRRVDATALGRLALHLPGFLLSLAVVLAAALVLDSTWGVPPWTTPTVWLASGALVFHGPSEDMIARHFLKLRYPLPHERARLEPVWHEVAGRAGIDGHRYRIRVEDSEDLNAFTVAGHIIGVTDFALERLTTAQLAAVLAHELGHHTGGHTWAATLTHWYALPGRAVCRAARALLLRVFCGRHRASSRLALLVTVSAAIALTGWAAVLLCLLLCLLGIPYAMAALSRRAELRADRHAASLGFAPMLQEALELMEDSSAPDRTPGQTALGRTYGQVPPLARLLTSHPDHATRLHHLRPYLPPR